MKIDIGAIVSAIQQAIVQTATSLWEQALKFAGSIVLMPIQTLQSMAGMTGSQRLPNQPTVFEAPVDTNDLVAELTNGHTRSATVRDLDRDGVTQVFRLANLAKISKDKRAEADLSAVERDDVRAVLIKMTPAELEALTKAGSGAVRRLLVSGDAKVWGVPSVHEDDVLTPPETELALRLRAVKAAMAKPKGSAPFRMPNM